MGLRKRKRRAAPGILEALRTKRKIRKFATFDIESKADDDQAVPGFTRPFLVGFFDPQLMVYDEYRDEPHLRVCTCGRPKRPKDDPERKITRIADRLKKTTKKPPKPLPDQPAAVIPITQARRVLFQQNQRWCDCWREWFTRPGGCIDKLMNRMLRQEFSGYIFYAHNGGNFDFLFLLKWVRDHSDEYGMEVIPVQSSIQVIRVWRKPEDPEEEPSETWEFLDTFKLLPMTLQKACETFLCSCRVWDEEKKRKLRPLNPITNERECICGAGKAEHDLATHEDEPSWSKYLKQDCVALSQVMTKVTDMIYDLGGEVGITTPSTSLRLFRRKYMGRDGCPDRIPRYEHWHDCKHQGSGQCQACFHDWIRAGYCGGRTEIHTFKGRRLKYYDFNSSYAASMRDLMPIGTRVVEQGVIDWRRHHLRGGKYGGWAECLVYIPETCDIPPLPYRDRRTGKLIFPTGWISGVWSMDELALLNDPLVNGKIIHVKRCVWMKMKPMFAGMVDDLFRYRDKSLKTYDEGLDSLAKLLINGGYGKFAMRRERQSLVFLKITDDETCYLCDEPAVVPKGLCSGHEGSKSANPMDPDVDVYYQANVTDAAYIMPHVSAHITATARVRLWNVLRIIKNMGGRIYYLDTDSVITDVELPTSHILGALKDEYPGKELSFESVQPKVYMIEVKDIGSDKEPEAKITMKGFPKAERVKDNFRALQDGKEVRWEQLEKVRTLARTGFQRGPLMKRVSKSFQSPYDKRQVNEDGNTTRPLHVDCRTDEERLSWGEEAA